ncbi:MAG: lamin tail domain-containing protein [Planctomycetes bacterium]|nr:lamin tail domain-containing protein [Planctomycetota bacterium]
MLAALGLAFAATVLPQGGGADAPVGLTVVVVDVGQGDGIVVRAPNGTVHLIDAGENGDGTTVMLPAISALQPTGYGFTFLSHFHDDHQGGLDEVLNALPFTTAYDRGDVNRPTTTSTNNYLAAAGARRTTVTVGAVYQLGGGATLTCLCANGSVAGGAFVDPTASAQEENSRSVALRLDYGQFAMWLGGDLTGGGNSTADVEDPATLACGDVDVYKLNHHGSNTSTSVDLVARLQPELAVVSCGTGNSFGHPTPTIVNRINQAAAARALLSTTTGSANTIGFGVTGSLRIDTDGRRYRATAAGGSFLEFWCDEVALPQLAAGDVRVSEIQRNPNLVPDTNGEYVEVVNIGPRPVSLRGLQIADNSGTVTIASNFALLPGRPMLFQIDGAPSRNGGQPLGMALPFGALSLADTTDSLTLSRPGATIDSVAWSTGFPGGSGVAAERRDLFAAGTAGNFAAATLPYGPGDLGSPGSRNPADTTVHPVQIAVTVEPETFTLHGTALDDGFTISVLGLANSASFGFPFLNAQVPLDFDPLFAAALTVGGCIALLPFEGYRSWSIPSGTPNPLAGQQLYAAHVLLSLDFATVPGVSPAIPFVLP